jgi:hypothetical protein
MEERRKNILVAPCFFHGHQTCDCKHFGILNEQIATLMIMYFFIIEKGSPRNKMVWRYERPRGFMEQHLLGCFFERM